jgi:hypothetical protein
LILPILLWIHFFFVVGMMEMEKPGCLKCFKISIFQRNHLLGIGLWGAAPGYLHFEVFPLSPEKAFGFLRLYRRRDQSRLNHPVSLGEQNLSCSPALAVFPAFHQGG